MKLKNIIKKCAKKILNDDVKIINTKINYENFSKAMKDLMYIPFEFDNEGATIVHYTPETYEPLEEEE